MAASVEAARVYKSALLHDPPRRRIAREVVGVDVVEVHHVDAVVDHELQRLGADAPVPVGAPQPVAHFAVVGADVDVAHRVGVVAYAADGFARLADPQSP